ncbi:hypothetical protein [Phenylobacterium sp.]|uniref:hypothetical protein n=1 Tax=Phenylobacterium sp. TaxID=1871053 RepID=UPI0035B12A6B
MDVAIRCAFPLPGEASLKASVAPGMAVRRYKNGRWNTFAVERFTASFDAAMALSERLLPGGSLARLRRALEALDAQPKEERPTERLLTMFLADLVADSLVHPAAGTGERSSHD